MSEVRNIERSDLTADSLTFQRAVLHATRADAPDRNHAIAAWHPLWEEYEKEQNFISEHQRILARVAHFDGFMSHIKFCGFVAPPPCPGMEFKYGLVWAERKEFHKDEPLFLVRAADPLALDCVNDYYDRAVAKGCAADFLDNLTDAAGKIAAWQSSNPSLVKEKPD